MSSWIEKGKKADRYDQVMRLVDKQIKPQIRRAFQIAVKRIKDEIVLSQLERLLEQGQMAAAEQLVVYEGGFNGLSSSVKPSLITAAQEELKGAGNVIRTNFNLDVYNPQVVDFVQQYSFGRVQRLENVARETLRDILTDALKTGSPPRQQARDIRTFIGLTPDQRQYIVNYRNQLESGDLNAITRALRDRRSDPLIQRHFQQGKKLTPEDINRLVSAYTSRWTSYRAETIARTESLRALNAGARLTWIQAAGSGQFRETDLYRRWFIAPSCCVCPNCKAIPGMNPKGVGLREDFNTPLGDFMDPPLHPQCRCYVFTRPR